MLVCGVGVGGGGVGVGGHLLHSDIARASQQVELCDFDLAVDETCHSAAPPSSFSRRLNSDGERATAE